MKLWFLNLGIGKKLILIFSILIILTVLISSLAIRYLSVTNNHVVLFSKEYLPADDLLLNIDRDMQQILVAERTMFVPGLRTQFEELKSDIYENLSQIDDRWQQFLKINLSSDITSRAAEFEKSFAAWKSSTNEIIEMIKSGSDPSSVAKITLKENSGFFTEARNILDKMEENIITRADTDLESSDSYYNSSRFYLAAGLITFLLFSIAVCYYLTRSTKDSVLKTSGLISELGKGILSRRIEVKTKDEFGEMGNTLNQFADDLQKYVVGSMKRISEGDFNFQIPPKANEDEIAPALNNTLKTLKELKSETDLMFGLAIDGDLESRGNAEKFRGGYKDIVAGFNNTINTIVENVRDYENVIEKIGKGDLTARMTGDYKGNYKILQKRADEFAESLNSLILNINEAVQATASAATEISSSTEEMAAGAQEQSVQTSEVASAVEEMTRTILETSKNTETAALSANGAKSIAEKGKTKVDNTKHSIEKIVESSLKVAGIVASLAKQSEQIGEITQVINDIADQTNLLALNAAIEAARAGEQGRGFAVVADEVRKLAERTSKATKEIADTIKAVQTEAIVADKAMEEANILVREGMDNTKEVESFLLEITTGATKVADLVSQISAASEEQSSAAEQITKNIESINNVTQESASGIQQVAGAAEDLNRLTNNLQSLIERFKVRDNEKHYSIKQNGRLIEH